MTNPDRKIPYWLVVGVAILIPFLASVAGFDKKATFEKGKPTLMRNPGLVAVLGRQTAILESVDLVSIAGESLQAAGVDADFVLFVYRSWDCGTNMAVALDVVEALREQTDTEVVAFPIGDRLEIGIPEVPVPESARDSVVDALRNSRTPMLMHYSSQHPTLRVLFPDYSIEGDSIATVFVSSVQ